MRQAPPSIRPRPYLLWSLVLTGITAISFASILIRLADAPSLAIAAYRVGIASLLISPYFAVKVTLTSRNWTARILAITLLSGFFLALHFAFWIRSVQMTSIASSATLVSTTPLFVALFGYFCRGEQLPGRSWLGILLVITGSSFITGNDFHFSSEALCGDFLALAGALAASGYLLAGRFVRRTLDLGTYTLGAYGSAAVFLLVFNLYTATPLSGFSNQTYLVLILLAVIPQLIGHTTFNWTLGFLPPTTVAVLILGEPLGATLLAYLFFEETLSPLKALGLFVLGTGIVLTATAAPHSA
jgi:drug/metabolite transporter (DMT)-like permease